MTFPTNHPEPDPAEVPLPRLPEAMVRDLSVLVRPRGHDVPPELDTEVRLAAEAHFRPRSRVMTLGRLGGFAAAAAAVIVVSVFVFRTATPPQPAGGGLAFRDDASRSLNDGLAKRSRIAGEVTPVRGDVNNDGVVDVRDALALGIALRASPVDRSLFQDASDTPSSHGFGLERRAPPDDDASAGEPDALAGMFQLGDANADGVLDDRDVEAITRAAVGAEQLPAIDQAAANGLAAAKRELVTPAAERRTDRAEEAADKRLTTEPTSASPPLPPSPVETRKDGGRGREPPSRSPAGPASDPPALIEPAAAPGSDAETTSPQPPTLASAPPTPPAEEWVDLVINPQGVPLAAYQVEIQPPERPGFQARVIEALGGLHPAFSATTFAEAPGRADANVRSVNFVGLSFAPPSGLPTGPTRVARFRVRYEVLPDAWKLGERLRLNDEPAGAAESTKSAPTPARGAPEPDARERAGGENVWENLTRHITAATRMGKLIPVEVRLVPAEPGAPP